MNNHMKEVAKMLGVEIGEEFEIDFGNPTSYATVYLDEEGLKIKKSNMNYLPNSSSAFLEWLLVGLSTIKRKPWRPKFNEEYYSIGVDGTVEDGTWLNDFLDYSLYKIGNCYRTIEEARANRNKWGTFYDSDEVLTI